MAVNGDTVWLRVKRWQETKKTLAAKQDMDSLRSFTESMNALSRALISEFHEHDPEFFTSLAELANNAATLTDRSARLVVNGKDRKQL